MVGGFLQLRVGRWADAKCSILPHVTWSTAASLLVGALVAFGGWIATHRFTSTRDRTNKRRELRVSYLIDAYRQLEWASNRPFSPATAAKFETALADIQLFGTPKQVRLAQEFAVGFARNLTNSLDELLEDLRRDLRQELELEAVPPTIKYLRASFDEKADHRSTLAKE